MADGTAVTVWQPDSEVGKWLGHISAYEKEFEKWERRVEKIVSRYRDEKRIGVDRENKAVRFNILWSNVQTLVPATFSRLPQPDVSRRFADNDPVGRVASLILERALDYEVQHYPDYRATMKQSVLDRFLGGRGTAWARYEPHMRAASMGVPVDGVQITEDVDEPGEELEYECAPTDYVHWHDFGHTVARTWEEVTAVWRRVYLTREQCVERFGKERGEKIPLDANPNDLKLESRSAAASQWNTDQVARAAVYEIWDKAKREAIWLSKAEKSVLDRRAIDDKDPATAAIEFEEFFPCPKPLYATITNETLVPIPDFTQYQDQANELDILSDRIDGLIKALKVTGVYDASLGIEIARLFTEADNTDLKPVKNWQAFAEKNGLAGAIDIVDLTPIAKALEQAYLASHEIKNQIYEIISISDIVRGASDPRETLGAQKLKGQYASMRLRYMQMEVAQYATELLRLKAQIICTFDPETIKKIASVESLMPEDQQHVEAALAMLKNEPTRNFRIEIAADTLVQVDEQELKESRVELLKAVGVLLDKAGPIAASAPQLIPVVLQLLKFGITAFKAGKQIEGMIDAAADQLMKQAGQPHADPKVMEQQITEKVQQQVMAQNASKEIAIGRKAADLDIRELKFAAEQQVAQTQQGSHDAMHQQAHEAALKRIELDHKERIELALAKLESDTKVLVAQIQAKAALDQTAMQAEQAADADFAKQVGEGDTPAPAQAVPKPKVKKPLDKIAEMHGATQEHVLSSVQAIHDSIKQMADEAASPSQFERGPDGKVAAILKGKRRLQVIRENGKPVGIA